MNVNLPYHIDHNYIQQPLTFGEIQLIQLGTRNCSKGTVVERHLHRNWFELTVISGGSGTVYTNDVPIAVKEGDIYLSFPAEFHEIIASEDTPLNYDFFSFQTDHPAYLADLERIMQQFAKPNKRVICDDTLRALIRNCIAQFNDPDDIPYRFEMLSTLFLQIFISLVRRFKNDPLVKTPSATMQTKEFCFSLMHYIDTHIYTMKSPGELAEVTNYNYSYLSNLFRKATSQTLFSYFQKKRLETAAGLLREENLQITQIAQMLQYSSLYSFSKAFRSYYGISPREYRSNTKKEYAEKAKTVCQKSPFGKQFNVLRIKA